MRPVTKIRVMSLYFISNIDFFSRSALSVLLFLRESLLVYYCTCFFISIFFFFAFLLLLEFAIVSFYVLFAGLGPSCVHLGSPATAYRVFFF